MRPLFVLTCQSVRTLAILIMACVLLNSADASTCNQELSAQEATGEGLNTSTPSETRPAVELLLIGERRLQRIPFFISLNGQPHAKRWNVAFQKLHAFFDRNGNGTLSQDEVQGKLLSPFVIRQWSWGQYTPTTGATPQWTRLDHHRDDEVSVDELYSFYTQHGIGVPMVSVAFPPWTEALNEALVFHLDRNQDRTVTREEVASAIDLLSKLDANGDELIGPGELVADASYPGVTGSLHLTEQAQAAAASDQLQRLPAVVVQPLQPVATWPQTLLSKLDRDDSLDLSETESLLPQEQFAQFDSDSNGQLTSLEILEWATSASPTSLQVELQGDNRAAVQWSAARPLDARTTTSPGDTVRLRLDGIQLTIVTTSGKSWQAQQQAATRFRSQFAAVDADGDGTVLADELDKTNLLEFQRLVVVADRNNDQRLTKQELDAWIDCQAAIARTHTSVLLLAYGKGLFECLDRDRNGGLSIRELQSSVVTLETAGALTEASELQLAECPFQLHAIISRGQPASLLQGIQVSAPEWFTAMDRNQDGEISQDEFLGDAEQFAQFDTDGDSRLSVDEVSEPQASEQ